MNNWPLITTIVVQANNRNLSESAKIIIYEEARDLGIDVGSQVEKFISEQIQKSQEFMIE